MTTPVNPHAKHFLVEVLENGTWKDAGLCYFTKAKDAYKPAYNYWRQRGVYVRDGFRSKEYHSPKVRVRRESGTRAVYVFPTLCVVYS